MIESKSATGESGGTWGTNGNGSKPHYTADELAEAIRQSRIDDEQAEDAPGHSEQPGEAGGKQAEDAPGKGEGEQADDDSPSLPWDKATEEFLLKANDGIVKESLHDEANADCVVRLFSGKFLYCGAYGWLRYTGTHWTQEGAELALHKAISYTLKARRMVGVRKEQTELVKFCAPSASRLEGALKWLKSKMSDGGLLSPSDFDANPDLLNCANGVINLDTGEFMEHDGEQRFMHCTAVAYRHDADTGPWLRFLEQATGGNLELVRDLQMAVGYSLTGHTREETLFYIWGPARSGKGTFTETLLTLLGKPIAAEVDFTSFTANDRRDPQGFDLAPLKPCRFVAASESSTYDRLDEARVKKVTGGNDVSCAFKHRDKFSYRPQFKIWLSSNQPVNADPDDDAVWGRLWLIPFPNSHLGAEDKGLKQRLKQPAALEGALKWAVDGALKWYRAGNRGLKEPAVSVELKRQHREAVDTVGAWLDECCLRVPTALTLTSELRASYETFCKANGVTPKGATALGKSLRHKGFADSRATGARAWQGVALKAIDLTR